MTPNPTTARRSRGFGGMLKIMRYNWPQYLSALIVIGLLTACVMLHVGGKGLRMAMLAAIIPAVWWTVASLIASHWIYDRSELYRWTWVPSILGGSPRHWLNLHAGLDESTPVLLEMFGNSDGLAADFFQPEAMTEPSISRARASTGSGHASVHVNYGQLPFRSGEFNTVFLLFAAHELRQTKARDIFFEEVKRVLADDGEVLVVEHLRDFANFAAFGPGFFHFLPHAEWMRLFNAAGFAVHKEMSMTPFVRVFVLRPML